MNDFIELVKSRNIKWNWYAMSNSPYFSWKLVKLFPDEQWNWSMLSFRATWKKIVSNPHFPWQWYNVSYNPNITWDIISKNKHIKWDWHNISRNPNITLEIILDNLDLSSFSSDDNQPPKWNWKLLTTILSLETILLNPDLGWEWYDGVSYKDGITMDIVKKHLNRLWDWNVLTRHHNITFKIIKNNPDLPWKHEYTIYNPNITFKHVLKNPDYPWKYDKLSSCHLLGEKKRQFKKIMKLLVIL